MRLQGYLGPRKGQSPFRGLSLLAAYCVWHNVSVRLAIAGLLIVSLGGARAQDFTPPQIPKLRSEPRWERLLQRQVKYLLKNVPPFPIPNELEHAIRPLTGTAYAAAACLKFAACENPDGVKSAVERILREVTRTHASGGGATASGRPWGNHWQSAFWAAQAVTAAWFLWPDLPADLRRAVVNMTVHEADRFLDIPAPYSRYYDTKAEENAWNSQILVLAAEALPSHPHAPRWRERAIEYMVSAFATPADRVSKRLMDGRALSAWLAGANVHPDFTLENHGFVHPDYMTTFTLSLDNAIIYRLLGRPLPEAMLHNAAGIYANLKHFSLPDGSLLYPSGTDWTLYRADMLADVHLKMERLGRDAQAAPLANLALEVLERMQARHPDGNLFAPGEFVTYRGHEQHAGWLLATAMLTAKLWDPHPSPTRLVALWRSLERTRMLEDARMFVVRGPAGISSFSWGLRVMGLTLPVSADLLVNPLPNSYVGLSEPFPELTAKPGRLGIVSAALEQAIARDTLRISTVIAGVDEEAAHVTVRASHGGRAHLFSFTALPSGESVFIDRWAAGGSPSGGLISLLGNPGIETDGRTWLNADNRLGYAVANGGGIRQVRDLRAVHIILNARPEGEAAIVTLPGASAAATRRFAASPWRLKTHHPDIAAVRVSERTIVTNFSAHPATAEIELDGRRIRAAVSGYSTRVLR